MAESVLIPSVQISRSARRQIGVIATLSFAYFVVIVIQMFRWKPSAIADAAASSAEQPQSTLLYDQVFRLQTDEFNLFLFTNAGILSILVISAASALIGLAKVPSGWPQALTIFGSYVFAAMLLGKFVGGLPNVDDPFQELHESWLAIPSFVLPFTIALVPLATAITIKRFLAVIYAL